MQDDDDNDDPMILNIKAKNHTSERTIVPWTVIFDKYEGLKSSYPKLPSYIRDFQVSCSHFVCLRKSITHPFQS